ncbi:MAG: DUF1788 domain-containing protein [Candidatus Nitricoxidivorans perseverans]|uniref:DUF1788 domain-containing protein n=1 Tax=Candidatus Nitricoxidivorans perseverans TaxID=2975601 RepID=A0AA49FL63_9PROT|nr:MAG: DUF1788 domain-containing protein [Candidatus Nitricoxidivorans perseverans]WIM05718.1 MAG: DUF1788 domain-containing protein [Candidatus Nitricoxidivorans perseverans]
MSRTIGQQSIADRFEHLLQVVSSPRFLRMEGLGNEVPFFICDYKPSESVEMTRMQRQLANRLNQQGVRILEINIYDLSIDLLKQAGDWDWYLAEETNIPKAKLLEDLQSILDVETVLVPAMADRMAREAFDVLFISGVGEVFPFIRSHNVLNNLQKAAKLRPTVMFFPGCYSHSVETGASLELFGRLRDDKYYRAFNIYDYQV